MSEHTSAWDTVTADLAAAAPDLQDDPNWGLVEKVTEVRRIEAGLLRTQVAGITADQDLTPEAKINRRQALAKNYEADSAAARKEAEERLGVIASRVDAKVRVKPPEGVTEATLGLARQDAMMILDRTDDNDLAQRMATLARSEDPAIRHLVLSGWAEKYLMGRGNNPQAAAWGALKAPLFEAALDDEGKAALKQQKALERARQALLKAQYAERWAIQDATGVER